MIISPNLVNWTLSGEYNEDNPILIDAANPYRFITKRQARELIASLTGTFRDGSSICLHLDNDPLYVVLVLAILASNCKWSGTSTAYTSIELENHFRLSQVDYVITSKANLETVKKGVRGSTREPEIILFADLLVDTPVLDRTDSASSLATSFIAPQNSPNERLKTLRDLVRKQSLQDVRGSINKIRPDSVAVLMQTSGTTGFPKLAARTHNSLMLEQMAAQDNDAAKPYEIRRLFCTPIFHAFAFPKVVFGALRLGHTTYIMKRFDDTFASKVKSFKINETFVAPPILFRLANTPATHSLIQSLRLIAFGGARLTPELRRRTLQIFSVPPRIVPVYGMTEGGWFTTLKYPETDETGCSGRLIQGYEIRVSTMHSIQMSDGQTAGELLIKGPQIMEGYVGNPEASREAFTSDGWFKTGDIGHVSDGKVYLVDRSKDLIKVSGFQVTPTELENALLHSSEVADAAVFGVGEGVDEHPLACVVRSSENVTAKAIVAHLRTRLAGYKVSKVEIRFVEPIPRSPAGKILKKNLRQQYVGR